MTFRKIKIVFVGATLCITASLLLDASALGEDKPATDKKQEEGQAVAKSELTDSMKAASKLQAGFALVDYGREENDPMALLVAARILGTTPVRELKFEPGEENDKSGNKSVKFDDGAGLMQQAQELIGEAQKMSKELPNSEQAAVEALAKATTILLKERDKGVAGQPAYFRGFIRPGGSSNPYVFQNIALTGNYTCFRVQSLSPGVDLDLKVVGALSNQVYGYDHAPNWDAAVGFNHFPIAVVNVFVENCSGQIGEFIITSN